MHSFSGRRCRLVIAASLTLLLAGATSASAATYTWGGGSGNWSDAAHWTANPSAPGTIPGNSDDVVIPGPGTFTVTINNALGGLFGARSMTLGDNASGSQELLIKTDLNTGFGSGLTLSQPSTIAPHGQVTLDQDPSTPAGSNQPYLGFDADLTNQGTILSRVQAAGGNGPSLQGQGFLINTGTLRVQSGKLTAKGIVNTGAIVTDAGAQLHATSLGNQSAGVTQNAGTITNNGSLTSDAGGWKQNGGAVTGNAVHISTPFQDAGGTGPFVLTGNGVPISGTIPAGQTVSLGIRAQEESNFIQVQAPGLTIAPGATVVIQGSPANGLEVNGNPVTVNGTLRVAMPRTATSGGNDRVRFTAGLVIGAGGVLDVQADSQVHLSTVSGLQRSYVNNGTLSIAPGAELWLFFGSTDVFTNGSGGTLSFGIASATRFGKIKGVSGGIALGGTATGFFTDGFVPAVGAAFKVVDAHVVSGTFGSVGAGFTASYPADGLSASLLYAGIPTPPAGGSTPPPGGGTTTPADRTAPKLTRLKVSGTKLRFTSSEAGKVRLSITKRASGRRVGGRCVKATRSNRRKPSCTRTITVSTRSATLVAGATSLALPKLPPGRYTVSLIATDAAGNKAKAVTMTVVVKAKRKQKTAQPK
jgi:hypothetical protein